VIWTRQWRWKVRKSQLNFDGGVPRWYGLDMHVILSYAVGGAIFVLGGIAIILLRIPLSAFIRRVGARGATREPKKYTASRMGFVGVLVLVLGIWFALFGFDLL
jgi:hypothetical protein